MSTDDQQGIKPDAAPLWTRIPTGFKGATATALLGFVVSVSMYSSSTVGGEYSCSYTDLGALGFAALTVIAVLSGIRSNASQRERLRLQPPLVVVASVILLGVAALHVARGLGAIGGLCA